MICIMIGMHATTHKVAFGDDIEMAKAELAKLMPRLGERWSRNRDEAPTHTISCPTGDVVIVLDKVELARILDDEKDADLHQAISDRDIQYAIRVRLALKEAGVLLASDGR